MTEEEYYARIKAEYEASTDEKLVEWARPYFEGTKKPNSKDRYIICSVSDRAAQDIFELTGSDVKGFNHVLRCDEVSHINKRHGKKGKADSSMRDISDLGRIAYVLENYDEIIISDTKVKGFNDKNNNSASALLFVKRIDGHIYIAEALTDSLKQKELHIQTMYKARTSAYFVQKKEGAVDDEIPRPNVQNEATSTTSILPQPEKNVNSLSGNFSDSPEQQTQPQQQTGNSRAEIASEMAQIKEKLRGKSPAEIAEMTKQAQQKNKQNNPNSNRSSGKPSSGNGSDGNSGR